MPVWFSKYRVPLIIGCALVALSFWWGYKNSDQVSQERVLQWIQQGYPSQFCTAIYPNLKDCVNFSVQQCETIAAEQLQPCVDELATKIPQSMTKTESNRYYGEASFCFEQNMHQHILEKYLIDSDECRQRMS